jgi:3-oxoacyl-(acyl-carrier-protein) synthase
MLPAILSQIGLPFLIKTISATLQKMNSPVAKKAGEALAKVDEAVARGTITPEQLKEANRHIETIAAMDSVEFKTLIEQVNSSLRAEIASNDPYVRRMRPTFGYIMAATWAAQMLAIAVVMIDSPAEAAQIMAGLANLSTIWTVGLSVLGVYVYQRSREKTNYSASLSPLTGFLGGKGGGV